jgi:glucose-induced degradation protein 4
MDHTSEESIVTSPEVHQQPTPPLSDSQVHGSTESHIIEQQNIKRMDIDEETTAGPDMLSPMSADTDNKQEESELPALTSTDPSPSMGYDFSNVRVRLLSSSVPLEIQHTDQFCS